jgi:hypothetical protein
VAGTSAAACGPEQAGSSLLHAVFTSPPPTLHLAGDIDECTFPDLTNILAQAAAERAAAWNQSSRARPGDLTCRSRCPDFDYGYNGIRYWMKPRFSAIWS